ncbi:MAG TPA: hypothetical protein VFY23_11490 [Candidatus Limnocylindrales bacterium]|nr:hypothetical protein [Candidatus Limnocylindrales bacterium]
MPTRPTPTEAPAPVPSVSPVPPAEAAVVLTCDGPAASLSARAVRAQPDGVHVEAVGQDGSPAEPAIWIRDAEGSAEDRDAEGSAEEPHWMLAEGTIVQGAAPLVLAPGTYLLTCPDADPSDGTGAELLVTDPDGLWKAGDIECEGGGGVTGSGSDAPAPPLEAIALLRSVVLNFRPDDVLEPAGYPDAPSGWIRLVRDGQVVAAWSVRGSGRTIGISSMEHCPGADIEYREPEGE